MSAPEALFSRFECEQITGQLDVWECIAQTCTCEQWQALSVSPCPVHGWEACEACGASSAEPCFPGCAGFASMADA